MITTEETAKIIKEFGEKEGDTGSAQVQVAILTKRISNLTPHFEKNKQDFHSKVGLMKMIGQRKSLLKYIEKKDANKYKELIQKLGLRK